MRTDENRNRAVRALLALTLTGMIGALPVAAAAQIAGRPPAEAPNPNQSWADQQRQQAWATRKLAASPLHHQWVSIRYGDRVLRAYVTFPAVARKVPIVIVVHEVFGLTDSTLNTADEIARLGYVTIAPDMVSGFGPGGGGTSSLSTSRLAGQLMTVLPDETVNAAFNGLAQYALKMPQSNGKLAIVGLSWGGGAAFRYAAAAGHNPNVRSICVFYDVGPPTPTQGPNKFAKDNPPIQVAEIDMPIHGFYPSNDKRVINSLQATKDAMAAAGKPFDPVVYDGADHAYMRVGEDPADPNPANRVAVKASLARLAEILGRI